jgi:CubicO group peptidase (beta-lactamase class C family)
MLEKLILTAVMLVILSSCNVLPQESSPASPTKIAIEEKDSQPEETTKPHESEKPLIDTGKLNKIKYEAEKYLRSVDFNGAVLMANNDSILLEEGFGMADVNLQEANKSTTLFRIASLTKQFTAAAILQLEEAGLLSTGDRLKPYFPDYKNWGDITIHQLLSQTSGIARETQDVVITPVEEILRLNAKRPITASGGFHYSNINYILLGRIIEQVSKLTYEEYMDRFIFGPISMTNSGVASTANKMMGYASGDGKSKTDFSSAVNYEGAGSIYSTVLDLYRWNEALNNHLVISQQSTDKMFTSYSNSGYGYGWYLNENVAYHLGNINGYGVIITRSLSNHSVIIVLSNKELRRAQTVPISNKLASLMENSEMIITQ